MPRYHYIVLLCAVPGKEREFDDWYDNQHIHDVQRVEGVVGARRYNVDFTKTTDFDGFRWRSVAIYDLETDDPIALSEKIRELSGTPAMPKGEGEDKVGMIQILASPAGAERYPLPDADKLPERWRKTDPLAGG